MTATAERKGQIANSNVHGCGTCGSQQQRKQCQLCVCCERGAEPGKFVPSGLPIDRRESVTTLKIMSLPA